MCLVETRGGCIPKEECGGLRCTVQDEQLAEWRRFFKFVGESRRQAGICIASAECIGEKRRDWFFRMYMF